MHIARFCERLPRLQIQFLISRSFRPRESGKSGIKNPFLDSPKGSHPKEDKNVSCASINIFSVWPLY